MAKADARGYVSLECPECGNRFVDAGVVPAGRAKRPVMFGIGLAITILCATCLGMSVLSLFFSTARTVTVAPAPTVQAGSGTPPSAAEPQPAAPAPAPAPAPEDP